MPEKNDTTKGLEGGSADTDTVGEIPPPPRDDLNLPGTNTAEEPSGIAAETSDRVSDSALPGESHAVPSDTPGTTMDKDENPLPPTQANSGTTMVEVLEVADSQPDSAPRPSGSGADTPPPMPGTVGEIAELSGEALAPTDDSDNWPRRPDINSTTPVETRFFADGGRSQAERERREAAEDQRALDQVAREAKEEALEFDPMKQIRMRTWIAAIAALAAVGAAGFFAGRETRDPGEAALQQLRVPLDTKTDETSSLGEELERAKAAIAETEKELKVAQKESSDAQEKLLDAEPLKMWIPSIPLKEGKRGRYCPIDTFALNEKFEAEGYSLVEIRQGKKPSYLFLKQTEDGRTHFIRVFIRKTSPKVRWDEFQPAQRAAVQAVEWFETIDQEQ